MYYLIIMYFLLQLVRIVCLCFNLMSQQHKEMSHLSSSFTEEPETDPLIDLNLLKHSKAR